MGWTIYFTQDVTVDCKWSKSDIATLQSVAPQCARDYLTDSVTYRVELEV